MKNVIMVLCMATLVGFMSGEAQVSWQFANGPWHANIEDIAIGLKDGQPVMYAADSVAVDPDVAPPAVVLKSTDQGETWLKLYLPAEGVVRCVSTFRDNADIVYAAIPIVGVPDYQGAWKSEDGGETWTHLAAQPQNLLISRIVIHPTEPDIVWVGSIRAPITPIPVLYRSTSGGEAWQAFTIGEPDVHRLSVSDIAVAGDTVFVSTYNGTGQNEGVWRTRNGGLTWTREVNGMTGNLHFTSLATDPGNTDVLYAGNWGKFNPRRLYKTSNATTTCAWEMKREEPSGNYSISDLNVSSYDPQTVIASTGGFG